MLAHAALSGLQCGLWMSQCRSANGLPVHPIGYGLTAARYAAPKEGKAAWVGVTPMRHPSDGYDLLEHYEIIAAGGLPYVLHLCAPLPRPPPPISRSPPWAGAAGGAARRVGATPWHAHRGGSRAWQVRISRGSSAACAKRAQSDDAVVG